MPVERALEGLRVVEVALGTSELGTGMAVGLPGMIFADQGAEVVRVQDAEPPPLDRGLPWGRVWHRDKRVVRARDSPSPTGPPQCWTTIPPSTL